MKRSPTLITAILSLLAIALGGFAVLGSTSMLADPGPVLAEDSPGLSKISLTVLDRTPLRVVIPRLEIDASVQSVGLDAEGRMDVPDNYTDAGWFRFGPAPGELGNSVIAAHLTDEAGRPAVFSRLSELQSGDEIHIETASGTSTFRVSGTNSYDKASAPLEEIFGLHPTARLNLITCDGEWQQGARSYSHRLVVFSEAENSGVAVLP